ncbi:hypothetical protein D3C86_1212850 [compost metagenome]
MFQRPPEVTTSTSIASPSERRSRSSMPVTKREILMTRGSSAWRRPKASSWLASFAPRWTPASAFSSRLSARSLPITSLESNCRLPAITCRRLLKSCATPPVSWPMDSIFCACCRAFSVWRRSAISASTRASRLSFNCRSCSSARMRWRISRSRLLACSLRVSSARRCSVMSVWTPTHSAMAPDLSKIGTPRIKKVR